MGNAQTGLTHSHVRALMAMGATRASVVLQTLFQMANALLAPMAKRPTVTKQHAKTARKGLRAPVARVSSAPRGQRLSRRHNQRLARTALELRLEVMVRAQRVTQGSMPLRITSLALHATPANTGPEMILQARVLRAMLVHSQMVASPAASPAPSERLATQAPATRVKPAKKELQTTQ